MSQNVHSPKCVVFLGFAKSFFTILGRGLILADSDSKLYLRIEVQTEFLNLDLLFHVIFLIGYKMAKYPGGRYLKNPDEEALRQYENASFKRRKSFLEPVSCPLGQTIYFNQSLISIAKVPSFFACLFYKELVPKHFEKKNS